MDSQLNIVIRVNGRQAQQQLQAVSQQLKQVQSMVGKTPTTAGASSPWSPAIAQKHARQAAAAAKAAGAAHARATKQAATQSHKMMVAAQNAQTKYMQSVWNMQVKQYAASQAKQIAVAKQTNARLLAQQKAHQKRMSAVGGLSPMGFAKNLGSSQLVNAGKNINWVGRQLTYNFTLPLAAAGAALTKFYLDNERAMTRVAKVYGDVNEEPAKLKAELEALDETFKLLSTRFGIHREEVINVGAAWAALGAAGVALPRAVQATIETSILGDVALEEATTALIATQQQWAFSTKAQTGETSELTIAMAELNMVENVTAATTTDLLEVQARAAGVARSAGVSFRELLAMTAALVPATGSAANAGTAIRSIISSFQAPTAQAIEAFALMGITVASPEWMGKSVTEKLKAVATGFENLSAPQRNVISATIGTRWQISRLDILLRDINDPLGNFNRAMNETADTEKVLKARAKELGEVLKSDPKKFEILTNSIKNTMTDAIIPLMPAIMSLVKFISDLATAFSELSPETQKWILLTMVLVAALGPVMSLLGSTMQLFGTFGAVLKGTGKVIGWFILKAVLPLIEVLGMLMLQLIRTTVLGLGTLLGGITATGWIIIAAIAAIAAAVVLILNTDLEDKIWDIIVWIGRDFAALPGLIARALRGVLDVIRRFMQVIVDALSYLNPFQRHSPSLVDNVRKGVSTILDEYSRLRAIPSMVRSAAAALEAFSTSTSSTGQTAREIELRKKANVEGAAPQQQAAGNALVDNILALERQLPNLESAIAAQEAIVDDWTAALKTAGDEIKVMERHLEDLEEQFEAIGNQIEAANDKISELADTPIQGMGALEDQIFANQHAQNLLNMELLEFERLGLTLDGITDKYAAMAGEIETLRGTQEELRNAGAGSDVLGWYDQQIAAIQAQKTEMSGVEETIQEIENRLDALDLEGRFLELTKAINFDPLERQIEEIAFGMTELPFDEIVAQILQQKAIVEALTPTYEEIGAQVERERAAIEAANDQRDLIATKLDMEQEKLDKLKDAYSDIKNLIQDMESALSEFGAAMKSILDDAEEMSRLEELFAAGEGVDYEDMGGTGGLLGREGDLFDIEAMNAELQAAIDEAMKSMGDLDLLKPLKDAWEKVKTWFKGLPKQIWDWLVELFPAIMGGIIVGVVFVMGGWIPALIVAVGLLLGGLIAVLWDWGGDAILGFFGGLWEKAQEVWDGITEWFVNLWHWIKDFFGISSPSTTFFDLGVDIIQGLLDGLWSMLTWIGGFFAGLGVAIAKWANDHIVQPIWQAMQWVWGVVKDAFGLVWEVIKGAWEGIGVIIDWVWENVIKPVWDTIKSVIENILVPVFEWLWERGKEVWGFLGTAISFVWTSVISPIFDGIKWALENVVVPAFETAKTIIEGIWNAIGASIRWVWDNVISPVWGFFKAAFENVVKPAFEFLRDKIIKPIMEGIFNAIKTAWNMVAGIIESGAGFFISAFNLIAKGVNAVTKFLGLGEPVGDIGPLKIDRIETVFSWGGGGDGAAGGSGGAMMAAGGIAPASRYGGAYNAPRAIVGEGSKLYPEFVIPTDPQYRGRALDYWQQAGSHLMQEGGLIPETLYEAASGWKPADAQRLTNDPKTNYGRGWGTTEVKGDQGWMGKIMGGLASAGKFIAKGALNLAWKLPKLAAEQAIKLIPEGIFRQAASSILRSVDAWVTGRDKEWDAAAPAYAPVGMLGPGAVGGGTGPVGTGATSAGIPLTFGPGSWKAFTTLLNRMNIPYTNLGTYAARPTASGGRSYHNYDRAMDFGGTQAQLQRIDHALYDAFAPHLHELIWQGPNSRNVYNGKDHSFRSDIANAHRTHVHASMAAGGRFYIPNVPGGVNLNVSEGRSGEQVQILPVDDKAMGGTAIVINGNLEFPNVRSGEDAKDFIENLKALAS